MRFLFIASLLVPICFAARERAVSVDYTVTVQGIPPQGRVAVWLPVPHNDGNQTITNLKFTSPVPHRVTGDAFGNRIFYAELIADSVISMQFQATRREQMQGAERPAVKSPGCCLGSDRLVPIDGRISEWA